MNNGHLDFHSFSFLFVVIGILSIVSGIAYTWYDGLRKLLSVNLLFFYFTRKGLERTPDQPKQSKAPFSNRLGPMIMGTGIFIVLCGLTYMLEVKDSKNRHFIIGDCYNNFIYNVDPSRSNQPLKKLRYTLVFKIIYTNYLQLLADNCEYNASNLDTA